MTRIQFELDGKQVEATNGETIWQVAKRQGREIPHLCYSPEPDYRPDGNCRACMVEIEGERVLAASCKRTPSVGMKVKSASPRATAAQKMVMELLVADQPARATSHDPDSKFWHWAEKVEVTESRFPTAERWHGDASHPAMRVNLDACIQCGLCVRACREVQVNDVIGMAYRNHDSKIVFDFDDPMGESTCVACGECVQACPTGALMPSVMLDENQTRVTYADKKVDSLCPFCGVGCQVTYQVKDDKIIYAEGRDGPANHNRLCVKGRFGFDYIHHPHRLTRPLVRLPNAKKDANDQVDPANPFTHFREATWEEALDIAAGGLVRIRDEKGVKALAGFGSAKGSNEEAYLFQKLVRTGFGSNNVDHCTRLCHASSVAALMEGLNSGAVSAPFAAAMDAEVIIVIGANPTVNHPVAATFIKNATKRGAKLVVIDPRRQTLSRHAYKHLQFKPGSDVAMLNAMLNTIIAEGLTDEQYIAGYTEGFDDLKERIKEFTPEKMEPICGIPGGNAARSGADVCAFACLAHLLGHGHQPACARHRQCALPDRARADHRADRPARHRAASVTRTEQRAGRFRRGADSDVPAGLSAGRAHRSARAVRAALAPGARSGPRPHRGRDHERDPRRRDLRHVYRGREPRDVGPRSAARARGAGQARSSRGAGSVRHRDGVSCRRDPAGVRFCGEVRHVYQHRPPRAAGARGDQAARRRAAGSLDHPGNRQAHGAGLAL